MGGLPGPNSEPRTEHVRPRAVPYTMRNISLSILALGLLPVGAAAQDGQFTFGVTWRSVSLARMPSGPVTFNMNEADILTFGPGSPGFGNLNNPALALQGGQLGIANYTFCLGSPPNTGCGIEVDAISQGADPRLRQTLLTFRGTLPAEEVWFSTDEFAMGAAPILGSPTIRSEGGAAGDISADVWALQGLGPGPLGPGLMAGAQVGVFDGNGMVSLLTPQSLEYRGIGLVEPNTPGLQDPNGDNLDSLNLNAAIGFPSSGYYYSLDSSLLDPLTQVFNSGTAEIQIPPVSGADVLFVATSGGVLTIYAPAASLGLELIMGDVDDVDALVIAENGSTGFQPSSVPYDWEEGSTPTDMLLFSVRRGSSIIGRPDSFFGLPIEPGDILTTPLAGGNGNPGILYAAERLGLATARTDGVTFGDDLNALDFTLEACFDCNNNGVEDAVDISTGGSSDTNGNGIPDECEAITEYCFCTAGLAPCGNSNAGAGCANSETLGAHLFFMGSNKVAPDDLLLLTESLPANKFGLYYMGTGQLSVPLGHGVRCVGGSTFRFGVQNSGPSGTLELGQDIVADSCSSFGVPGCIVPGDTWNFQAWYRDPSGPCPGQDFNFSNGISVEFIP
ncbi:MAG: hypothetical protein ACI8X5_002606 [Planctomycetota bacterium]